MPLTVDLNQSGVCIDFETMNMDTSFRCGHFSIITYAQSALVDDRQAVRSHPGNPLQYKRVEIYFRRPSGGNHCGLIRAGRIWKERVATFLRNCGLGKNRK